MEKIDRYGIEEAQDWRGWCKRIPAINFKQEWDVKIIPPFSGAMVRFIVEYNGKSASVYLDCFDALGYFGAPYWEVYPVGDDVGRVAMEDVAGLLWLIEDSLRP